MDMRQELIEKVAWTLKGRYLRLLANVDKASSYPTTKFYRAAIKSAENAAPILKKDLGFKLPFADKKVFGLGSERGVKALLGNSIENGRRMGVRNPEAGAALIAGALTPGTNEGVAAYLFGKKHAVNGAKILASDASAGIKRWLNGKYPVNAHKNPYLTREYAL